MSGPLTDEQIAEIRERAATTNPRLLSHEQAAKQIITEDVPALLAEVERLQTRLAAAEMVCLAYGAAPTPAMPGDREKALFELWWEWAELEPKVDHSVKGPLTDELIHKLAARRDEKRTTALAASRALMRGEG